MKNTVVLLLLAIFATTGMAKDDFPAVSHDGLHLVPHTKLRAVYMQPATDLGRYDRVALLDTYVAFAKHWQREHNEEVPFVSVQSSKAA